MQDNSLYQPPSSNVQWGVNRLMLDDTPWLWDRIVETINNPPPAWAKAGESVDQALAALVAAEHDECRAADQARAALDSPDYDESRMVDQALAALVAAERDESRAADQARAALDSPNYDESRMVDQALAALVAAQADGLIAKADYDAAKEKLPAVVVPVACTVNRTPRKGIGVRFHNGLYPIDVDSGAPKDLDERRAWAESLIEELRSWPHTGACGHSAGWAVWGVLAGPVATSTEDYKHCLAYLIAQLPEAVRDAVAKNQTGTSWLRFLCPGRPAYHNPDATHLAVPGRPAPGQPETATHHRATRGGRDTTQLQDEMQAMLEENGIAPAPLTPEGMVLKRAEVRAALAAIPLEDETGHPDWIRGACALCAADANWQGFGGREIFVEWTGANAHAGSTKPARADAQYSELERSRDKTLTIGPIFEMARTHGWTGITGETTPEPEPQPREPSGPSTDQKKGSGKKSEPRRAKKGEAGKDALGLVDTLRKLGLEIRFNSRSLKSEVLPMTDEGSAIVTAWGKAAKTQPNGWTILQPAQSANLRARIAREIKYLAGNGQQYALRFSREEWREANLDLSATTYADPFQEWLESLPAWDGQDRWAMIFTEGYGVIPGEHHTVGYLAHAGKLLVIPCVGRLYEPGSEASTMTVLIGDEGIGKSLGVKCLFPKEWRLLWFSDSINLKVSDQQLLEKVSGFVLLEIGELSGMMRVEQERVKTLISSCQDVARLAYREDSEAFPRRFHWCGSANDVGRGVLPDSSENRRFWPVNIPSDCNRGRILQWFRDNHQQLWAQALVEWKGNGIEAWLNPEQLEPERLDAAAAQRRTADGSSDLVDAIETLDPEMLAKGHTLAELLRAVGAFGQGPSDDGSALLDLAEVATKIASGPGAGVAHAVTMVLKRRGWQKTTGNPNRGRAARGQSFWWPPADGPRQNVRGSEVSEGASGRTQCENGGMNTGSEADNVKTPPHTTPSCPTPWQPLTPSDRNENEQETLPSYEESQALLLQMISSDPIQPVWPIRIPFDHLPEEVQDELTALPEEHEDPVKLKLCDRCAGFAVLYHELIIWTGVGSGLGIQSTVTHKRCMGKPLFPG